MSCIHQNVTTTPSSTRLTSVWTAPAPLHALTVAAHYSRPSYWHSPHISEGQRQHWAMRINQRRLKYHFHVKAIIIGFVIMLLLPWVTMIQAQRTTCTRLLSKQKKIYNLYSCLTVSVDSGGIKTFRKNNTNTGSRRHTNSQSHIFSLTLLKPALIRGITEASSLSGLKKREHVSTQTSLWKMLA